MKPLKGRACPHDVLNSPLNNVFAKSQKWVCVITLIESTLSPWPVITFVIPCFLISFKFHTIRNKCPPGLMSPKPFCTRYILMDTFSINTSGINSRDAVGVSDCHQPSLQEDTVSVTQVSSAAIANLSMSKTLCGSLCSAFMQKRRLQHLKINVRSVQRIPKCCHILIFV